MALDRARYLIGEQLVDAQCRGDFEEEIRLKEAMREVEYAQRALTEAEYERDARHRIRDHF